MNFLAFFAQNSRALPYIYIYIGELVSGPCFGLQRVRNWATLRVRNWATFWGAISALQKQFFFFFFFEDLCVKFRSQFVSLVFWVFINQAPLSFLSSFFSNIRRPLFLKCPFQKNVRKCVSKSAIKTRCFLRVSIFQTHKNLGHKLQISVSPFQTISVFVALRPLSFCRTLVFEKCPILCPFLGCH